MAKVNFNKLNKIKSLPAVKHLIGDVEVEVAQYLPLEEKLDLITAVIEQAGNGEEGFFNIVKLNAYYRIEMIKAYTNISFTDKQLEETPKLFDLIELNGVWGSLESVIPQTERDYVWDSILNLARETTNYNNSVLGVLKTISSNQNELNFEAEKIVNNLNDPQALTLVKEIMNYTGLSN